MRDYLLGKIPSDFDFTTKATPSEILVILEHYTTFQSGAKYGTIGAIFEGVKCEITTFRNDGAYADNRHPDSVRFCDDLSEDLKRRDFSVNALAYDILGDEIIDICRGAEDLERGIIACVGDARARLNEDSLRILRAFSLMARYDFDIERDTLEAIIALRGNLRALSIERVRAEIAKILAGDNAKSTLRLMRQCEILAMREIPARFDKIPHDLRNLVGFLIFSNPTLFTPTLQKRFTYIREILRALDSKSHHIRANHALLHRLIMRLGEQSVRDALRLKIALSKNHRIYKKHFKITRIYPLKLSGGDLAAHGFKGVEIGKMRDFLAKITLGRSLGRIQLLKIALKSKDLILP